MNYLKCLVFLLSCPILFLGGCLRTHLNPETELKVVERLKELNDTPIVLTIDSPADTIVGHQYLMIFIPFGRIEVPSIPQMILPALTTELSLRGYRVIFGTKSDQTNNPGIASLHLAINRFSVSAYDYIFTRQVYAELAFFATLSDANGKVKSSATIEVGEGEFRQFGFAKDLTKVVRKVTLQSSKEAIRKLRL